MNKLLLLYHVLLKALGIPVLGVLLGIVLLLQGIMSLACKLHTPCVEACEKLHPMVFEHTLDELVQRAKEVVASYAQTR